jgi:hypothetical protein
MLPTVVVNGKLYGVADPFRCISIYCAPATVETTVPVIKYDRVFDVPFVSVPVLVLYVDVMDPFEYVAP